MTHGIIFFTYVANIIIKFNKTWTWRWEEGKDEFDLLMTGLEAITVTTIHTSQNTQLKH